MTESVPLVTLLLGLSLLLGVISAVRRYTENFIILEVTILMFLGAILAPVPLIGIESEDIVEVEA